jgi:hypothetical protein
MVRVTFALLLLLLPSAAWAQGRFALLIGNQAYNAKVGPLKNPHNDVALIGAALRSLGFKVTEIKDADYRAIDTAINRHVQNVRREGQGSISLVYYSGHGAANPDTKINYLIPVDVANADDEDLWTNSLNLNKIVEGLREQAPEATHYVVFDACRNELNLTSKGKKALAGKGFVPIAYTPGVMVAYATAPGKTAADVGSGSGPYAKALADEMVKARCRGDVHVPARCAASKPRDRSGPLDVGLDVAGSIFRRKYCAGITAPVADRTKRSRARVGLGEGVDQHCRSRGLHCPLQAEFLCRPGTSTHPGVERKAGLGDRSAARSTHAASEARGGTCRPVAIKRRDQ